MTNIQPFDFTVNLLQALLWQYNDAVNLQALLQQKQNWYNDNQTAFWSNWFQDVFDLRTANTFGLQVWSIILNIPILISTAPAPSAQPGFAFGTLHKNYAHGNFYRKANIAAQLTPEQARTVLRLRYFQMTTNGTVGDINRFLHYLFGAQGGAYVLDAHDMTLEYVFRFVIPDQLAYIFNNYDILPRPAGVGVTFRSIPSIPFGFETVNRNFEHGNFEA